MTANTASAVRYEMPRAEYPRPDWQRSEWLNLNGSWSFQFDHENHGLAAKWQEGEARTFRDEITVPFSWSSPLSGIGSNDKGIAWYGKETDWAPEDKESKVFLRFGAVDYKCDAWVNGQAVGSHTGGYGTFEFDVTDVWAAGKPNQIIVRVEDFDHAHQARGKQGYGEIRGIWQPVWLEARPQNYVRDAKFNTRIDGTVEVTATVVASIAGKAELAFSFADGEVSHRAEADLAEGSNAFRASFAIHEPKLWSPESPYLYEGEITLESAGRTDTVSTYFGVREIGTALVGDKNYRWITLNGKPVYLNGTLDQSFHPTGFFTYPTDREMQDEIYLLNRMGLNFVRIHIKPEEPRKLYWADKLGILVMEDMPCFWGDPDDAARAAYESEALEVIDRDYNHPSIFSWAMFNETWGLKTNSKAASLTSDDRLPHNYLPETQEWVRGIYRWAKELDPTRIIEDNSPCNYDHVESDLNTWHFYVNGYNELRSHVTEVVEKTYPGSTFNYIGGNTQSDAPLMNSECGNVWGIEGGAGDSDLAWHYRYMMNEFRRHDKMCGFVFTEFKDVINEFNGYYRLDGSDKQFGYEWFNPGMSVADLHSPDFVVIDAPPCRTADAGGQATIELLRSSFSDRYHGKTLQLSWELWHDNLGTRVVSESGSEAVEWNGYGVNPLASVSLTLPSQDAVAVFAVRLTSPDGRVIARNFVTFDVRGGKEQGAYEADGRIVSVPVGSYSASEWPHSWHALQDHKVNGGDTGYFAYEVELPTAEEQQAVYEIDLYFEASSKRLLKRNIGETEQAKLDISFMHGKLADPEFNANTYFMTDTERHEAKLNVRVDGVLVDTIVLPDNPADSRGVLSWHYQQESRKLEEAGSYGYLCRVALPSALTARLNDSRKFKLQLEAAEGGLALYGRNAGRYPIDIVVHCKD
ncbi:glycoside hydrolase family 2 protein [Paenibacillus arenilitoris]|uniref:Glycoside hydrolase family 2 n=1 Tax=Paenibacillus arenilitoris TaxID=2772299 RepID=A0A927H6N4_9BACL|nr:sugar-binding domain-containing protein [Paenibacillus arenilitoris]MBD2870170.1 glycoside hydrolase family 2 [Paenibacillus arenilitoris]